MVPCDFDESNCLMDTPADMSCEECVPLSVYRGSSTDGLPIVISCWKLTKDELEEFQRTGRVWLYVVGHSMPPVSVEVKNPFRS